MDGAEVVLVLVVEVHRAKGASSRAAADAVAVRGAWVAREGLAIGSKGVDVGMEGLRELVALVQLVDLVVASTSGVDAGACEDTSDFSLVEVVDGQGRGDHDGDGSDGDGKLHSGGWGGWVWMVDG